MKSTSEEKWVLKPNRYSGVLMIGGEQRAVSFSAEAGEDHRCTIDLEPVDRETYVLLHKNFGRPGLQQEDFELTATADNGDTFTSQRVSVTELGGGTRGFRATLSLGEATVGGRPQKEQNRPVLRKWFRSFRSFQNVTHHTPLGEVAVWGATKSRPDDVSGYVAIQAPLNFEAEGWRERAEAFLSHMHTGLSFAHGGRLQCPRVDYCAGDRWETTFYSGSGFAPEMALQYFLDHDPFIQALVDGYFKNGPLDDGFLTALGWLHMPTTFDEVRLISAMTALEVIVDTQLSADEKGGLMPKPDFRALRKKLYETIDNVAGVDDESKSIFKAKIGDANKKVLSQKIDALFKRLSIPTRDFDSGTIRRLTSIRNEIVHRGVVPNDQDIWEEIILIRELMNRILMGAIGFEGRYCCYIGGENERTFPDLKDFPQKAD